jgi:hypothetical protein
MTMLDFRDLVEVVGARIVKEIPMVKGRPCRHRWGANLRADSALYVLEHAPAVAT